ATILRPLKDPLGDILGSAALSPVAPCSHASDARNTRSSQYRWRGLDRPSTSVNPIHSSSFEGLRAGSSGDYLMRSSL
ncbi:MAG: hypothetical protein KIH06_00925, partial [Kiritimatiellae bacterium]|nr:hypothetical protein [Kiritimatiellia bacterium]